MKVIQAPSPEKIRLQAIDALRGIAALGVVFYHAAWQSGSALPANILHWPVKLLLFLSSFGYIGVFLFFVISGFCIHMQWAKARANQKPEGIQFGSFWRRRFHRLYPPYLIAFALFMIVTAFTSGINITHFFLYDVVMHLFMLHNLDPNTCYSINGVFWTLAIEEQLYLAYFLLLFLRTRWGWGATLFICAAARVGWFMFSHAAWVVTAFGIPVPEAAASHWFTWALGAIAVEAALGLVKLPKWCGNLWLGAAAIAVATATSTYLPSLRKDSLLHDLAWLFIHPIWGFGFFVVVNRAVQIEQAWTRGLLQSETVGRVTKAVRRLVTATAFVGVFSYSLYLTHELVIMQSWWFIPDWLPAQLNMLVIVIPATIAFAWLFYLLCEKPYLRRTEVRAQGSEVRQQRQPVTDHKSEIMKPLVYTTSDL